MTTTEQTLADEAAAPESVPFLLRWAGGSRACQASGPGELLMVALDVRAELRRAGRGSAGVAFRGPDRGRRLHSAGRFLARIPGDELDQACVVWWAYATRTRREQR